LASANRLQIIEMSRIKGADLLLERPCHVRVASRPRAQTEPQLPVNSSSRARSTAAAFGKGRILREKLAGIRGQTVVHTVLLPIRTRAIESIVGMQDQCSRRSTGQSALDPGAKSQIRRRFPL
jgi:hypothetical protein